MVILICGTVLLNSDASVTGVIIRGFPLKFGIQLFCEWSLSLFVSLFLLPFGDFFLKSLESQVRKFILYKWLFFSRFWNPWWHQAVPWIQCNSITIKTCIVIITSILVAPVLIHGCFLLLLLLQHLHIPHWMKILCYISIPIYHHICHRKGSRRRQVIHCQCKFFHQRLSFVCPWGILHLICMCNSCSLSSHSYQRVLLKLRCKWFHWLHKRIYFNKVFIIITAGVHAPKALNNSLNKWASKKSMLVQLPVKMIHRINLNWLQHRLHS